MRGSVLRNGTKNILQTLLQVKKLQREKVKEMKNRITVLALTIGFACTAQGTGNNVQQQLDDLKAGLHQVHMNTLQKYSESWGLEDRANIAKLQETKLDKSVFSADQARQDKALASAVASQSARDAGQDEHINAVQGAAQTANDRASNLEVRADGSESAIRETNTQLQITDARSQNNAVRLDSVESANTHQDTRTTQNSSDIVQLYSSGEYAQQRIDAANANIQANRNAITSTNRIVSQHSEQLANHEQRLTGLEQETQRGFSSLHRELGKVKKSANAGTSSALSAASIPQVTEYQTFALGAGAGGYEGEQAVAVGFSARVTSNMVVKAAVTRDTNQGTGWNLGTSIGW